jgi:hypothetical protein
MWRSPRLGTFYCEAKAPFPFIQLPGSEFGSCDEIGRQNTQSYGLPCIGNRADFLQSVQWNVVTVGSPHRKLFQGHLTVLRGKQGLAVVRST